MGLSLRYDFNGDDDDDDDDDDDLTVNHLLVIFFSCYFSSGFGRSKCVPGILA